jgi:hypothetical protein
VGSPLFVFCVPTPWVTRSATLPTTLPSVKEEKRKIRAKAAPLPTRGFSKEQLDPFKTRRELFWIAQRPWFGLHKGNQGIYDQIHYSSIVYHTFRKPLSDGR